MFVVHFLHFLFFTFDVLFKFVFNFCSFPLLVTSVLVLDCFFARSFSFRLSSKVIVIPISLLYGFILRFVAFDLDLGKCFNFYEKNMKGQDLKRHERQ